MKNRKKATIVDPYNSFAYVLKGMEFSSDSEAIEYFTDEEDIPSDYEDDPCVTREKVHYSD